MSLFYREFGNGPPLIILHGLMGSSDNWVTLGKQFAERFHVRIIDQRNHGQSFHSDDFDYEVLTSDLGTFLKEQGHESVSLIGHSMGGKVVMQYALQYPDHVEKLLVADMAPKSYPVDYDLIFSALNAVKLDEISSRSEAEEIVKGYIEDFGMRQFLLKNLTREGESYIWKANLPIIQKNIEKMGLWSPSAVQFTRPTLFLAGSKSGYIKAGDADEIRRYFPSATVATLEAGHWLHAEKPDEFMKRALQFLSE